jgi:molybdopterin-guanine dinucleotide biosynthesis protein A
LERIGGERLVQKVINNLYQISQEVLVVTSKEQFATIASLDLEVRIIVDVYPGKAAFGGIYTGLAAAATNWGLVVACDMPFLNIGLLEYLVDSSPGFDVVIPKVEGKIEPLHAVYSKNCLTTIQRLLDNNILQMLQLLDLVKTRYITEKEVDVFDPEHWSFFNINTLKDFNEAEQIFIKMAHGVQKQGYD